MQGQSGLVTTVVVVRLVLCRAADDDSKWVVEKTTSVFPHLAKGMFIALLCISDL